jgi:subtilisin family serine protease
VIHADEAWLATNQGAGVRVAILDSGIDPRHIDMFGTVDPSCSASFIEGESELIDRSGHGTLVASIVRSNGFGVASVAPDAILCSVKIGTVEGLPLDAIFAGIIYSATLGVDVINMSFGGYADTKSPDDRAFIQAFQRVIDFAARRGALLVASAGNQAINTNDLPPNIVDFPASLEHVIGVGATGPVGQQDFDRIASYSNVGRDGVDVFAPGGDSAPNGSELDLILGPCSASIELFDCSDGLSYVVGDGTSFAAPHVAGEAAVIESQIAGDQDGGFLTSCILKSADAVTGRKIDPLYDHGRINVLRGAQCAPASGIGVNLNAK